MTDLFIKSFNRAYYLDRCLASAQKFLRGHFRITVLDDGTPPKYLEKIRQKYPETCIKTSENYEQKIRAIAENQASGKKINGFRIPTKLWTDAAKNGSEYFIMTEDDVWFTDEIHVDELAALCKAHKTGLLKLGWLGNTEDDKNLEIHEINEKTVSVQPKNLILKGEKFMEAFFLNRYKLFTILYKLGKVDNTTRQKYWALNSILMGFYEKNYWLKIWDKMDGLVDEKRQLIHAAAYYKKQKNNPGFLLRLKEEAMRTTFQSSATNSYHEYGVNFDVDTCNRILNEAWYHDELDPMENFPKDFSEKYIERYIENNPATAGWKDWAEKFRAQYRNIGCRIEY